MAKARRTKSSRKRGSRGHREGTKSIPLVEANPARMSGLPSSDGNRTAQSQAQSPQPTSGSALPATSPIPESMLDRIEKAANEHVGSLPSEMAKSFEEGFGMFAVGRELVRRAIDAAFWASLTREEGRHCRVNVRFGTPRGALCRIAPVPLGPHVLRKLSPLQDGPENAVLLDGAANIVGIGWGSNAGLQVSAFRPGVLVVSCLGRVLAVLEEGEWHWINGARLDAIQRIEAAFGGADFPDRFRRASVSLDLAVRARAAGRGAIFVLVENQNLEGLVWPPQVRVEQFSAAEDAFSMLRTRPAAAIPSTLEEQRQLDFDRVRVKSLLRIVSEITSAGAGIDGAAVLELPDLRLRGFGAKIDVQDDRGEVLLIELPSNTVQSIPRSKLGGTRHQASSRLVQRNRDASVLTVSQDGTISFFAWVVKQARAVCIRHLDRYLAAEVPRGGD